MREVKQKAISARIDKTILWQVDQEAQLGYVTRNGILNKGSQLYCHLQDVRREIKIHPDNDTRRRILRGFFLLYAPECADIVK